MGSLLAQVAAAAATRPCVVFGAVYNTLLCLSCICSAAHKAAMEDSRVEIVQADVSDEEYFDRVLGDEGWEYIINVAAETDLNKSESFHAKQVAIASKFAAAAARVPGLKKFVQVSTAAVYASSSKPVKEDGKLAPWTTIADYSLRAEEAIKAIPGLPWVILRPANVYGPGDVGGLMPR